MAIHKWNPATGTYETEMVNSVNSTTETANVGGQKPTPAAVSTPNPSQTKSPTGTPYSVGGKPTAYTGTTTPEGVTNPYTGGVETASPAGTLQGVNQGVYSPENKQKAWAAAGGTGTYNPEAFYRGQNGAMEMKPGYVSQAATQGAVTGTPAQSPISSAATPAGLPGIPGTPGTGGPKAITGDANTDAELAKLKEEEMRKRKEQFSSYALYQGEVEKNKNYYTNFDEVNSRYNNVQNDIRSTLESTGQTVLTDEQAQAIAGKYGLGLSDVKQPLQIFEALNLTDEGERVLGKTKFEQGIADAKTNLERQKADLANNLKQSEIGVQNQIADVGNQMKTNVEFMKASGAWSGASRSSAYEAGIENVRTDALRTIQRLGQQMDTVHSNNATTVARIGEDFNKDTARAKADFDANLKDLKHNQGMLLNGLEEKYGSGNKTLTQALDAITEEFAGKSIDVYTKYVNAQKAAIENTNSKIEQVSKLNALTDSIANKRFNEYTANNGTLLMNASMTNILGEVKSGSMTIEKAEDLKNIMTSSITNTLSKFGAVSSEDVHTIETMLNSGKTPTQIVATMKALPNYTQKVISQVHDLGNGTKRVQYADGTTEDVESATGKTVTVPYGSALYDTKTGTWVTNDGTVGTGGTAGTGTTMPQTDSLSLIKKWEGFRDKAYQDSEGVWTIGYGFTNVNGKSVQPGDTMSRDEADAMFADKVGQYTNYKNFIKVPLSKSQEAALNSFEYNLGKGIWQKDAMGIIDKINSGDLSGAADEMKKYVNAEGKQVQGLVNRRNEEARLIIQSQEQSAGFDQNKSSQYDLYLSKGTLPTGMKAGMPQTEAFIAQAGAYEKSKESEPSGKSYSNEQLDTMQGLEKMTATERKEALKESGLDSTDYAKFLAGTLPPSQKQLQKAENIYQVAKQILDHPGLGYSVGFSSNMPVFEGTDAYDFKSKLEKLSGLLTVDNMKLMTGVLTDADMELLRKISSPTFLGNSEDSFKKDMQELVTKFGTIIAKSGAQSKVSGQNPQSGDASATTGAGMVTSPSGIKFTITKVTPPKW